MDWDAAELVEVDYVNHRGERAWRRIVPQMLWFGVSDWHEEKQWFMRAWDEEKSAVRDFSMMDVKSWRPVR
jgi:predicted DNA-binding transcriptional regulator YafY